MALIKCKECGAEVSEHAKKCPHCGAVITVAKSQVKNKRAKSMWIWCVTALIIILGCVIFYQMQSSKTEKDNSDNTTISATKETDSDPINILSLCYFDSEDGVMEIKKANQLSQSLDELKFQKTSETESEIDFGGDDYTDLRKIRNCTYERGNGQNYIKVKIDGIDTEYDQITNGYIEIVFSDKSLTDAFLSDAEQNHFTKISPNTYQGPKYDTVFWTGADIESDGNTIIIRKRNDGE